MSDPRPASARRLQVATYNIHRGIGRDRRSDPLRVLEVILALDADLIALQEVETPHLASPATLALLGRLAELGYEPVLGPTLRRHDTRYGNVLLSRLPVRQRRRIDLSRPGREPRGMIEARLALNADTARRHSCARRAASTHAGFMARLLGEPRPQRAIAHRPTPELRCLATHLGLGGAERAAQIRRIAERVDQSLTEETPAGPLILLGDLNEWHPLHPRFAPLRARFDAAPARRTWPARWPLLALDRIWYRGGLRLETLEVVHTPPARCASDHLPLRAALSLPCG